MMAATVARRLLFKWTVPETSHSCTLSIGSFKIRSLSTQIGQPPAIDVAKLCANCGPFPWKLYAAVCLVRPPILEKGLNDMNLKYATMQNELGLKNDMFSKLAFERQRREHVLSSIEADRRSFQDLDFKEMKQEFEDTSKTMLKDFHSSKAEIGFENLNRRPRDSLILITKQKLGSDVVWMLPKEEWREDETLRESAKRALRSNCMDYRVDFLSTSPSGFYKYKFPRGARTDTRVGAKLFIYNAFVQRNSYAKTTTTFPIENAETGLGHAWVAKDELRKFMKPKYIAAIDEFVL